MVHHIVALHLEHASAKLRADWSPREGLWSRTVTVELEMTDRNRSQTSLKN